MRALGEKTRDLRQADADDDDFLVAQFAGARRNHDSVARISVIQ